MPSHLTRQVFRRILANEPIIHRGCLRRRQCSTLIPPQNALRIVPTRNCKAVQGYQQRRYFLNFSMFGKKEEPAEPNLDPGIDKMMELAKRQRMSARMPPLGDIEFAVRSFFNAKRKKKQPMTDTQAGLVLQSLKYYYSVVDKDIDKEGHEDKTTSSLLSWRAEILILTETPTPAHRELAHFFYERTLLVYGISHAQRCLRVYVRVLCLQGSTETARDLVLEAERSMAAASGSPALDDNHPQDIEDFEQTEIEESGAFHKVYVLKYWSSTLEGFVLENNALGVEETLATLKARGITEDGPTITRTMINFHLRHKNSKMVQHWWRRHHQLHNPKTNDNVDVLDGQLLTRILRWCIANSELDLGHEIVKDVMATNPTKPFWDAIFVWAAGTKKSVDEIGRMMDVMERTNESIRDTEQWQIPDVVTINALVEFAVSQQDPYMAERFIALGQRRNIEPDAQTLTLQMQYRLDVGDVDGALIAYKALADHRGRQISEEEFTDDIPTINRLIVALCSTQRHDFDTIMNVTMDLADRKANFETDTISAIALLHLARDEVDDATDLLNTHAFHLSSTDRAILRTSLIDFALDPKTATARSWRTYPIIREVFDETDREQRTRLMTNFLNRGRADMGVHVFQHMRAHTRADTIPTVETYVAAFMGLAKLRELEQVEVVHNLLKLDFNVKLTTYLRNSLIIAYTACNRGRKALDFWTDIVHSKEGPNYNSIHIALRACERSPFGDIQAKKLWTLLRKRDVELDQALWASYAGALVGNGDIDSTIRTIEEAEAKGEMEVDSFVLGSVFNGAPGQIKQAEIETWAKEKYADEWAELEKITCGVAENGMRAFQIDRRVSP